MRKQLALKALSTALRIRRDSGALPTSPICVYDFVEKNGIEVRFLNLLSLEGMYSAHPGPLIIVSSERPSGRQAFTCAHEYGHHVFNHEMSVDEEGVGLYSNEDDEFLVDCFAGFLLMPKVAVSNAFVLRGWNQKLPTPVQILTIANYFGVGYSTLVHHMRNSLGIIQRDTGEKLLEIKLKDLREQIIGKSGSDLIVVDKHWVDRPVDLQVGDHILLPNKTRTEGACLIHCQEITKGRLFKAVQSGIGRLHFDGTQWSTFVRVARRDYVGRGKFRFLEEAE